MLISSSDCRWFLSAICLMFMVSLFSTAVPLTSLPFTSLNWLVTWLSFDMILFNSSCYIFRIDYFSLCHSIYPEMKTSLYSALLSTYSYTIHNGIKHFVCSFSKELIWHIACSYLQGTHLRQGWVKSLPHQLSLLPPVLTISPSPMAIDLQPTTLKSPPSLKKKKTTFFNTILPEAYYPISFFLSVPLTIFSAFISLLLPPKWTFWNIHCDCTPMLKVCEILLPLILIEIDTDIALCSWVLASLTNFNFKSFLSCSNCASITWCFWNTVMVFLAPYLRSYQFLYLDDFSLFMPDEVCLPLNTQLRSPPLLKPKALPHLLCVLKCLSHACVFIHCYVNNCILQYDLECLNFYFAFIPQLLI